MYKFKQGEPAILMGEVVSIWSDRGHDRYDIEYYSGMGGITSAGSFELTSIGNFPNRALDAVFNQTTDEQLNYFDNLGIEE